MARGKGECKALLDACTPSVYAHNAFRITGLSIDATTRDIKRRIDDLKAAEEMGDSHQEHNHVFALNPRPTLEQIRDAAHRLQDPERRILEEFFWFWPEQIGNVGADPALQALARGDTNKATNIWRTIEAGPTATAVARHNLAVFHHLSALDGEMFNPTGTFLAFDWEQAFQRWEKLAELDLFWDLVSRRIRQIDDARLTTGFARRMRTSFPEAMDKINAELALAHAQSGREANARLHIQFLQKTHKGLDNVPKTLALVSKPLRARIHAAIERAKRDASNDPASANKVAFDLLDVASEPVRILASIYPPGDHECTDLSDAVANASLECHKAFVQATEEWDASLQILSKALPFACAQELKAEFSAAQDRARTNRDLSSPKVKEILGHLTRCESLASQQRIDEIFKIIPPLLAALELTEGKTSKAYTFCADTVASQLREISVEVYNCHGSNQNQPPGSKSKPANLR